MQGYMDCSSRSSLSILNISNQKACLIALIASAMQVTWNRQGKKRRGMKSASNATEWYVNDPVCDSNANDRTPKVMDEFNILYRKNIRNLWTNGQVIRILGKNKQRSKFDTKKLLFNVVNFDVNCIKLGI